MACNGNNPSGWVRKQLQWISWVALYVCYKIEVYALRIFSTAILGYHYRIVAVLLCIIDAAGSTWYDTPIKLPLVGEGRAGVTAKQNGLNTYEYLKMVLTEMPKVKSKHIDHLMPYKKLS